MSPQPNTYRVQLDGHFRQALDDSTALLVVHHYQALLGLHALLRLGKGLRMRTFRIHDGTHQHWVDEQIFQTLVINLQERARDLSRGSE